MKYLCSLFLLTFSVNAFATGGFHCIGKVPTSSGLVEVHLDGTTGRVEGNPIVSNLRVAYEGAMNTNFEIPKEQMVGYWNNDGYLLLNFVDSNAMYSEVKLNYNTEYKKGVLRVNSHGLTAVTKKVTCLFE